MVHGAKTKEAKLYLRQMLLFVVAYLVMTTPQLFFDVSYHIENLTPAVSLQKALWLEYYLPFANVIIWGLNAGCIMQCLKICALLPKEAYDDSKDSPGLRYRLAHGIQPDKPELEMSLLENDCYDRYQ